MSEDPKAKVDIQSAEDFPVLGGSSEERVVMAAPPEPSQGFWELPMRPVKAATDIMKDAAPAPSQQAKPKKSDSNSPGDESVESRLPRLQDLLKSHSLELEEPMVRFLLTLTSASDCLDYLQAYHGDSPSVRQFAEAFVEKGLNSTAKAPKSKEAAKDAGASKAAPARKKRAKGKEVDPSLLGFTALPRGNFDRG